MESKLYKNMEDFHFGSIIKSYIDRNKISKAALARKVNRKDSAILKLQKKASLQLGIVLELSHALKHNFFADIAAHLPATYTSDAPVDNTDKEKIAQLEQEIMILKAEKAVLLLR
jgi:hypothetical protein